MELRLSDPKKKDEDMGFIQVDVCLMFRDATIKKGLVRKFLLWRLFAAATFSPASFILIMLSFTEMGTEEKQGMEFIFSQHTSLFSSSNQDSLSYPAFSKAVFIMVLEVTLMGNTRGQYHTAL